MLIYIYKYTTTAESLRGCLALQRVSQLAGDPLAGRTVCESVCEKYAASMALHTNVGLGDFVLMDKIDMVQFVKNLKIR